jgi:glycosyltransferase involved in cell wall biosynthesis
MKHQDWLFIGPTLLAGIGQVTKKYADLMKAEYISFGEQPTRQKYDNLFMFILPIEQQLDMIKKYYKNLSDNIVVMTVCETLTVHPTYEDILQVSKVVYCPSKFARGVLQKQFPKGDFRLLHHWTPVPKPAKPLQTARPYIFYTIGNVMDPRKNIQGLIYTFLHMKCALNCDVELVLKATCRQEVNWKIPGVQVINGLLSDEVMDTIHDQCHCYINCSHSEGVGMGAVEAAMRDKPVIITDFGGLHEYVNTPFVVETTPGPIGFDDFLYTKDLEWGHPSRDSLLTQMLKCYEQKLTHWDHSFTRDLVTRVQDHICELGKPRDQQTE